LFRICTGTWFRFCQITRPGGHGHTDRKAKEIVMNKLIDKAAKIPVADAVPVVSVAPVTLAAPGRGIDLELRVSAPVTGDRLPVIVLSHGHGPSLYIPSLDGYGPVAQFWAARGFVVIQPTHLNAKIYALGADAPGAPLFWRSRVEDMSMIVDRLDEIEAQVPAVAGRIDHERIAAVGHSMGGQTVGMILGAGLIDVENGGPAIVMRDDRYKAGVLLAAPGNGGDSLSDFARENYHVLNPDFGTMATPTLVVAGDADDNPHLTTRGAEWHLDPFTDGPGAKDLLSLAGGKHGLGGVAGHDAKETDDEDPDRLELTRRMVWAWLRSALYPADTAWPEACRALADKAGSLGRTDRK